MSDDPRLTGEFVRRLPATTDDEAITLVGVVHDHPASVFRTRQVVADADPDTLALELPALTLPLFVEYASTATRTALGGEMSAAIRVADTDRVVGIDGPSRGFVRCLLERLARADRSPGTVSTVLRSLWSVTMDAIGRRVAAAFSRATGFTVQVDGPAEHGCRPTDDATTQAADEADWVRQARTVMDVFPAADADRLQRTTREDYMAARLEQLRRDGSVVAVVGIGHLDPIADELRVGRPSFDTKSSEDERDECEDDEDDDEPLRDVHTETGDAARAEDGRDQCQD